MEHTNSMEEEDSDCDTGPTIEEIISAVAKRQSKFGLRSNLPPRPFSLAKKKDRENSTSPEEPHHFSVTKKANTENSSSPEENPPPKFKTVDLKTYMQKNTGSEAKTSSSVLDVLLNTNTCTSNIHGKMPSHNPDAGSENSAKLLPSSLSNLSLPRSSYALDARNRYMSNSLSATKAENWRNDFSQNKNLPKHCSQNDHEHLLQEKENKKSYFTTVNKNHEKDQERSVLATKQPGYMNSVPKYSLTSLSKEVVSDIHVRCASVVRTEKEELRDNSGTNSKREICPSNTKGLEGITRPTKVANTLSSPFKVSSPPSRKVTSCSPNTQAVTDRTIPDHNPSLHLQPNSSIPLRTQYDNSSISRENRLLGNNVRETSKNLVDVRLPKQACQMSAREHSLPSQQITDTGYNSGTIKCNILTSNANRGEMPSLHTPSEPCKPKVPPPPSSSNKEMVYIVVNGHQYSKLTLLGRGGSSKVYEVFDHETQKVKAIKMVELEGLDEETLKSYENEIEILKRLSFSDRIIKLYDYENTGTYLKLVMEKGSQDMASVLNNTRGSQKAPIKPFTIKHYWHGMLLAVQAIHGEGIIHSDLKPANFVIVNEKVKLIDFGIASSIQQDMTSIIKDSPGGTFNYMSPESVMDVHTGPVSNKRHGDKLTIKIGVKSDVWSLGCILYNLVYGRTPFQHITNGLKKLAAISDPNMQIAFEEIEDKNLEEVMRLCLQFDPRKRPSIQQLLQHPYLADKSHDSTSTPAKPAHIKSAIDQLVKLTPNSLNKITSMMQQMKSDS